MENEQKPLGSVRAFFKRFITNNLWIKISALFFALVLWGVVLTTQNPERVKVISNVPVTFRGQSDLHAKGLVVRGHPLEQLGGVSVRVSTPVSSYKDLTEDYLTATVNLDNVTSAQIWTLSVNPSILFPFAADSWVDATTPEKITVEIDTLISKTVPIEVRHDGTLPEGYWADEAELAGDNGPIKSIVIRGPKQDVQRVTKAVCIVGLTDRIESYNDAVNLVLWDETGKEIDATLFLDELPSVTVKMQVIPKKTIPVDVMGSLLGEDNLPANYELIEAIATPEHLTIVGEMVTLATISSMKVEGLDIAGRREAVDEKQRALIIPEGVRVLGNVGAVDVYVNIQEKTNRKEFKAVPIEVAGLARDLDATLSIDTVDISVDGRVTLVDVLDRTDIRAFVDLKNIREGRYEDIGITISIVDDATTLELLVIQSVAQVDVTVGKK